MHNCRTYLLCLPYKTFEIIEQTKLRINLTRMNLDGIIHYFNDAHFGGKNTSIWFIIVRSSPLFLSNILSEDILLFLYDFHHTSKTNCENNNRFTKCKKWRRCNHVMFLFFFVFEASTKLLLHQTFSISSWPVQNNPWLFFPFTTQT